MSTSCSKESSQKPWLREQARMGYLIWVRGRIQHDCIDYFELQTGVLTAENKSFPTMYDCRSQPELGCFLLHLLQAPYKRSVDSGELEEGSPLEMCYLLVSLLPSTLLPI